MGLNALLSASRILITTPLKELNKSCDADQNIEVLRILREQGINIVGDFIVSPDSDHSLFDNLERCLDENPNHESQPRLLHEGKCGHADQVA